MFKNSKRLALVTLVAALHALPAFANTPQVPEFDENEIVGMFAEASYVGVFAGTKTVTEAHAHCLSRNIGSETYSASDGNYHDAYKTCMKDFVPFKISGIDLASACPSQTVSWGQCQATIPATADGASSSVQNTFDTAQYEGYATFQCEAGNLSFVSGGCSRAVKACEEGQIVNWPVTSPLWADESAATVYRDKYGEIIHTPKGRCYARMPYSTSGEVHFPKPTTPEMIEPERYNMTGSSTPQRCFDSKWIGEPASGTATCDYIPKSCQAQAFNHNGCGFDLPAAAHDTIFVDDTPTPQNSLGSVEAYCWDGEWKIKARSCTLSCTGSIGNHTWNGGDPRSCGHNGFNRGTRVSPGDNVVIENVVNGMVGSVTYRCDNGEYTTLSEPCEPQSCQSIPASTWGTGNECRHSAASYNLSHGDNTTLSSESSVFVASGYKRYSCQYGQVSLVSEACSDTTETSCDVVIAPVDNCDSGVVVEGKCCAVVDGKVSCSNFNDTTPPTPPPSQTFQPSIAYDGSCMNCTQSRKDGTGDMYPYPAISSGDMGREIVSGVSVIVNTGCANPSDCEVTETAYAGGSTGGSLSGDFKKENLLNQGYLQFSLSIFCTHQGAGFASRMANGTISVRHKTSGEVKSVNYEISLSSSCGGSRDF